MEDARVRATDRHCRKMRRNNKFGAKNINLAKTIGKRKIASKFFCLASESSPPATSHCLVPLNGHQCVSYLSINTPNYRPHNSVADRVKPGHALITSDRV